MTTSDAKLFAGNRLRASIGVTSTLNQGAAANFSFDDVMMPN